jgi:cytochrome c oxidase accessory protein FixG
MKRGQVAEGHGDCIDCNLCVVTCPTGVDIRLGQQIGCINCGVCADACDSVMDKISRPQGLIRFASFHEIEENVKVNNPYLRPRPIFYAAVTLFAVVGIVYGLATKTVLDINVRHERSPQFTMMSNGSIQNVYHLDILNKTDQPADFIITITGLDGITSNVDDKIFHLKTAQVKRFIMLARAPRKQLTQESHPVTITLQSKENPEIKDVYKSMFIGPK